MTPEVKQRIEQIRQGIVPEGYKESKVGIIPQSWNVGNVGDCIEEYRCLSNDVGNISVYSSSRKGLVPLSDYFDNKEAVETNLGYKVVPHGYVTYRHMSDDDIFHFNVNKTGSEILVSSEYPVFTTAKDCDREYLISVLNSTARFRYFCKTQKLGGTRTRLYLNNLKEYSLALPPYSEQKKIAEILTTQDKAIELQGRKIEELKRFKQGCLERMFPGEGQKIPEKRFPGFTDDWEQRKLGELTSLITKGTTPLDKSNIGTVNFVKIESIDNLSGEITITQKISSEEHEGYLRRSQLKENDILFSIAGTLGRVTSVKSSILPANTNQALAIIRLKSGCLKYVKTYLKGKAVADFVKKNPTIGAQPNLSLEQVSNIEIALPSEIEQAQIGSFFENLDHLITLHQRKLEEMKKQKKALMQLLLTGIVRV